MRKFWIPAIFFPRMIMVIVTGFVNFLTADHCYSYAGKQPETTKGKCMKNMLRKLQDNMDRCPGFYDVRLLTRILEYLYYVSVIVI